MAGVLAIRRLFMDPRGDGAGTAIELDGLAGASASQVDESHSLERLA